MTKERNYVGKESPWPWSPSTRIWTLASAWTKHATTMCFCCKSRISPDERTELFILGSWKTGRSVWKQWQFKSFGTTFSYKIRGWKSVRNIGRTHLHLPPSPSWQGLSWGWGTQATDSDDRSLAHMWRCTNPRNTLIIHAISREIDGLGVGSPQTEFGPSFW